MEKPNPSPWLVGTIEKLTKIMDKTKKVNSSNRYTYVSAIVVSTIKAEEEIKKIDAALNNENRAKIIEIVKNKELSISQIKEKLDIAYKNVLAHITILEKLGFIKTTKKNNTQGRIVLVSFLRDANTLKREIEKRLELGLLEGILEE